MDGLGLLKEELLLLKDVLLEGRDFVYLFIVGINLCFSVLVGLAERCQDGDIALFLPKYHIDLLDLFEVGFPGLIVELFAFLEELPLFEENSLVVGCLVLLLGDVQVLDVVGVPLGVDTHGVPLAALLFQGGELLELD